MKISELIARLTNIHRTYGDIEAVKKAFCTVPGAVEPVNEIRVERVKRRGARRRFDEIDNNIVTNPAGEHVLTFR